MFSITSSWCTNNVNNTRSHGLPIEQHTDLKMSRLVGRREMRVPVETGVD